MRLRAGFASLLFVTLFVSLGLAQIREEGPPVPLAVGSSAGVRSFKTDRWGVVGIEIANPRRHDVNVHARFFFDDAQELQFGRNIWVPARSRRIVHCPVVPPETSNFERSFEIKNVLYEVDEAGNETILKDLGQALQRSNLLLKTPERRLSAIFPSMPYEDIPSTALPTPYDALLAARISVGLTRRVGDMALPNFPDQMHYLDIVDNVLIHNESPFTDAATVATIRQWVQRGGRLWVMLDQVPIEKVAAMLGDSFRCTLVDRVELTDFAIAPAADITDQPDVLSFERPVSMVRVDVEDMDVRYTVDGWPAAFVQSVGLGRVVYTTISSPAWVRAATSRDGNSTDPERQVNWLARGPLQDLATAMLDNQERATLRDEGLSTYVAERVGYRILPRRPVFMILLTYVVTLGVCGVVLIRRHSSGNLVWLAPVLIVVAATPIALMAMTVKKRVPRTSASIQIVQISTGSQEAHVNGMMALFLQRPENVEIAGRGSEAFMTSNWGREDTIRELLWTDYDYWTWSNLRLTGGMKMAELNKPVRLEKPMSAWLTFGTNGVEGNIEGNWGPIEDAQVHITSRRGLALHIQGEQFTAGQNDLLAKDQYVSGTFLNDEQRRRQTLIRDLTAQQPERLYSNEPTLLFWTEPLELEVKLPQGVQMTGAALVRVPLQIQRPPQDSRFIIPSTFLPFRTVSGPTGKGAASTYIPSRGEWVAMSSSSETWLRVQLPKEILPARLDKLRIQLQIDAPSRPLQVVAAQRGTSVVQYENKSPTGSNVIEITNPDILQLDDEGGVLVGILVGNPPEGVDHDPEWQIHDLQFTAHASR